MNIKVEAKTTKELTEPCIDYLDFTDGNFNYIQVEGDETEYTVTKNGFIAVLHDAIDINTLRTPNLDGMKLLCVVVDADYPDEEFDIIDKSVKIEIEE